MASATCNEQVASACLPLVALHCKKVGSNDALHKELTIEGIKSILATPTMQCLGGEQQLHLVANWIDAGGETEPGSGNQRLQYLDELLPLIDYDTISRMAEIQLFSSEWTIVKDGQSR